MNFTPWVLQGSEGPVVFIVVGIRDDMIVLILV
jgi:hypothetical protein